MKLSRYISAAREQIENDTGYACISQTFTVSRDGFPSDGKIEIPIRPLQSVSSIVYQDSANVQQTLGTTVYGVDSARRMVYRKYSQSWPDVAEQHDGVVITLIAGFGSDASSVPALIKQAILLQLTKWFVHRGDEGKIGAYDDAYEKIKLRISRSSYP